MEKRYQVFVSSTYTDLIEERKEVTQATLECNCFPAGMELFPASNKDQWAIIKRVIDDSDFYLLILAGRYGSVGVDDNGNKVGYTEMEFNYALEQKKPILAFLRENPESSPEESADGKQRLEEFRKKAEKGRVVRYWNNKHQLHSAVLGSLNSAMKDTDGLVGWVRSDSVRTDVQEKRVTFTYYYRNMPVGWNEEDVTVCVRDLVQSLRCKVEFFDTGRGKIHANILMPEAFPRRCMQEIIENKLAEKGVHITGREYT